MNNSLSPRARRPRKLAAALASLGLVSSLTLSGLVGVGIEVTEAAFSDTEMASARIDASWADGGWARSSTNAYTNYGSYSERNNVLARAERQDHRTSQVTPQAHTGTLGDINLDAPFPNFEIQTPTSRPSTDVTFCVQAASAGQVAGTHSGCTNSGTGSPTYTLDSQTRAKGWGRSGGYANPTSSSGQPIVWMETDKVTTMAECAPSGHSIASVPTTSFPSQGNSVGIVSSFSQALPLNPQSRYTPVAIPPASPYGANTRVTAWLRPQYRTSGASWVTGPVHIRATLTSRAYSTTGYALSDLYMTIDQYRLDTKAYLGSFTMVFSRSECGVKMGGVNHQPLIDEFESPRPPAYPKNPEAEPLVVSAAPLPNVDGTLPAPVGRTVMRGLHESDPVTSKLPPTTTMTSPSEHAILPETTTSAPPNPDDADVSASTTARTSNGTTLAGTSAKASAVTSTPSMSTSTRDKTSAAPSPRPDLSFPPPSATEAPTATSPAIVITDGPPALRATARLDDVDTITMGGEDLQVVVEGGKLPTDARRGAQSLEIWLNGGNPGTTWETFASDDPAGDGWRWAAVNRNTGTAVYIR